MHCVNHPGVDHQSFCQSCGKALCAVCVRKTPSGQILCEECLAKGTADQAYWQAFVTPPRGVPNPTLAAVLGLIPGVGAMYNGQLFKGLIHVVIFAVLVSITDHYPIFGLFIAAWVLYQSFEAFHTAKARRDGQPVPDPFGLNELGSWLNMGSAGRQPIHPIHPGQSASVPPPAGVNPASGQEYGPGYTAGAAEQAPTGAPYSAPYAGPAGGAWGSGYTPQPPYTEPYAGPYAGQNPDPYGGNYPPGTYPPGYVPPIPPVPTDPMGRPFGYRGREPVWAFILIGLGILFLLKSMGIFVHSFHLAWPLLLIGLGVWLIIRHVSSTQGGSK